MDESVLMENLVIINHAADTALIELARKDGFEISEDGFVNVLRGDELDGDEQIVKGEQDNGGQS